MSKQSPTPDHFSTASRGKYTARVLSREESCQPGLTYPGVIQGWVDGLSVEITPAEGKKPWIAHFAGADISPNAITVGLYHPCPTMLCIVARGAGYEVNVEDPTDWRELPLLPIMGAILLDEGRAILFWDYTRFSAIFADGSRWTSSSVSWDGIGEVQIENDMITADVWDAPADKIIRATIRLQDGTVIKGTSPELL